jgi:endonuclease/exonuclease/phosphatase family metal-dependent hydrolase
LIYRFEIFLRRLRLFINRSEWMIRLCRLSKSKEPNETSGLVMIQVDGLSHTQLCRAIDKGNMPFVSRLLKSEKYRLHTLYSGLPSSTPGVQGELFYGVKNAVPAFSYKDHETGKIIKLFDPDAAADVEHHLSNKGEPLFKGGSAYSDVYTGGAQESHFCMSSIGWGKILRAVNPFALIVFMLFHLYSFVRIAVLLVIEFFLAIVDCVSGLIAGRDLVKELKFVPTRVGITILLRELVATGAKMDLARGLPIVHLNLLGYDEQAHRRGPSSLFAHWTLRGIDDTIARIWRAAKQSARRDYDVWIYSDHGQEDTLAYPAQHGRTIQEAITDVFERLEGRSAVIQGENQRGIQNLRARHLGGKKIQKLFSIHAETDAESENAGVVVVAMGPLGFVYALHQRESAQNNRIARELVDSAKVPLVLKTDGPGRLNAWTSEGEFSLPEQKEKILGPDHPFLQEVTRDLIELCHHPDAGDFVICGWRYGARPYSFPMENGAHAGPGPEETRAFALLPDDTDLTLNSRGLLRPLDLRQAAFNTLGRSEFKISRRVDQKPTKRPTLRIMTYNIHSCIGMDGKISPQRIARVIAQHAPDIVALQELDVGQTRSNGVDQAHVIAQLLDMKVHFLPTMHLEKGQYGNAILTRYPMRLVRAEKLPGLPGKAHLEPRGAIWVAIKVNGTEFQIINTHLGLRPKERKVQAEALIKKDWLSHPDCRGPVILCGDFNALPYSLVWRRFRRRLPDAQLTLNNHRPKKTLFGRYPLARIDHVFVNPGLDVADIEVPSTALTRVASDHLPLIVDVYIPRQ